jgi:hypothetical protein
MTKLMTATTFDITMLRGSIKTPTRSSKGEASHRKELSMGNFEG